MSAPIETIIVPRTRDLGGGFEVRRVLPSSERRTVGPFVFFDQLGPTVLRAGTGLDVRPHPHIGLATVTYLFDGEIMHRDSLGTAAAMRVEQVKLFETTLGEGWGLGWILDNWDGIAVFGHDGNSLGQNAFTRVAAKARFGFCLQTNVEAAMGLYREVAGWLFGDALGVSPHASPAARKGPVADPARFSGTYRRQGIDLEIDADPNKRLLASVRVTRDDASTANMPPMQDLPLAPVNGDAFLLKLPIADTPLQAIFFNPEEPGGMPTYLHFGGRASRRVA